MGPDSEQPKFVERIASAIESYWLGGAAENPDLAAWWATTDAHDTALEMARAIESGMGDDSEIGRLAALDASLSMLVKEAKDMFIRGDYETTDRERFDRWMEATDDF